MDINCNIPDLVQAFFCGMKWWMNLVLKLAKPFTCTTVALNYFILTSMREQNKQIY